MFTLCTVISGAIEDEAQSKSYMTVSSSRAGCSLIFFNLSL